MTWRTATVETDADDTVTAAAEAAADNVTVAAAEVADDGMTVAAAVVEAAGENTVVAAVEAAAGDDTVVAAAGDRTMATAAEAAAEEIAVTAATEAAADDRTMAGAVKVAQLQQQVQEQQWELAGQRAAIAQLSKQVAAQQAQLESDQLSWYMHQPGCRCMVCTLRLQVEQLQQQLKGQDSRAGARDCHGVAHQLPRPREAGGAAVSTQPMVVVQPNAAATTCTLERIAGLGVVQSAVIQPANHDAAEPQAQAEERGESSDMLWSMFEEPRRKRGLRKSQRTLKHQQQRRQWTHNNRGKTRGAGTNHGAASSKQRMRPGTTLFRQMHAELVGAERRFRREAHSQAEGEENGDEEAAKATTRQRAADRGAAQEREESERGAAQEREESESSATLESSTERAAEGLTSSNVLESVGAPEAEQQQAQRVKQLRRALHTVKVFARRAANIRAQMRAQMHRNLRGGGASDSNRTVRSWVREGQLHVVTVAHQSAAMINSWASDHVLHSAVKQWALWRAARLKLLVQCESAQHKHRLRQMYRLCMATVQARWMGRLVVASVRCWRLQAVQTLYLHVETECRYQHHCSQCHKGRCYCYQWRAYQFRHYCNTTCAHYQSVLGMLGYQTLKCKLYDRHELTDRYVAAADKICSSSICSALREGINQVIREHLHQMWNNFARHDRATFNLLAYLFCSKSWGARHDTWWHVFGMWRYIRAWRQNRRLNLIIE